jgi:hypothetical protein
MHTGARGPVNSQIPQLMRLDYLVDMGTVLAAQVLVGIRVLGRYPRTMTEHPGWIRRLLI